MAGREKVISTFEKIISICKEDGCDFVDLTFEDAEQILALLKEQETEIRQLRLALDIAKGTCKGIAFETDEKFMGDL